MIRSQVDPTSLFAIIYAEITLILIAFRPSPTKYQSDAYRTIVHHHLCRAQQDTSIWCIIPNREQTSIRRLHGVTVLAMEGTPVKSGRRVLGDLTVNISTPSKLNKLSIEGKHASASVPDTKGNVAPPIKPVARKKRGIDEVNGGLVAEGRRGTTAAVKTREMKAIEDRSTPSLPDADVEVVEVRCLVF